MLARAESIQPPVCNISASLACEGMMSAAVNRDVERHAKIDGFNMICVCRSK
jgi:hypothetical protein